MNSDNWTVEEYYSIRDDVHDYLTDLMYSKRPNTYDLLNPTHKNIVNNYANLVYQNSKLIEPSISKDLVELTGINPGELTSFEHRLKTLSSIRRKIIADSKDYDGSYYRAAHNLIDAIRYTIILEDDEYLEMVDDYLHQLEDKGYQVLDVKNNWGKPFYQGINTRICSKNDDVIFELQFHTPVGYQIKEKNTRDLYQVIRDENAPLELRVRANKLRKLLQTRVIAPDGIIDYEYNSNIRRRSSK